MMDYEEIYQQFSDSPTARAFSAQQRFFNSNRTKSTAFRRRQLLRLRQAVERYEPDLYAALYADLRKSRCEALMTELGLVKEEIRIAIENLDIWSRPEHVRGTAAIFPAGSCIYREPYGVVLILSPWNYPVNLALTPLVGAIAAGNCAILKCSKSSAQTSAVLRRMINETFPEKYIYCADPEADYDDVLRRPYDFIFFTGSPRIGKTVMAAASEYLTPVSLELGGKSPCIVDRTANLQLAAKRIAWGKFMNAGQTCISVDYVLVDETVKAEFLACMRRELERRYPNAERSDTYPCIISEHHYERLKKLLAGEHGIIGGMTNDASRKIAPSILVNAGFDHPVMQEEIFGPLLPVIGYTDLTEVLAKLKSMPKPLACYIFTEDRKTARRILGEFSFGGGCVNDVLLHISNPRLPFGGVGNSGMGGYHGKYSFETFSHKKSVVTNSTKIDVPVRYAPFSDRKYRLMKLLLG